VVTKRARESEETDGDKVAGDTLRTSVDKRKGARGAERRHPERGSAISVRGKLEGRSSGTVAARNKAVELVLAKTDGRLRKPEVGSGVDPAKVCSC
jgi:hypothetical protein